MKYEWQFRLRLIYNRIKAGFITLYLVIRFRGNLDAICDILDQEVIKLRREAMRLENEFNSE